MVWTGLTALIGNAIGVNAFTIGLELVSFAFALLMLFYSYALWKSLAPNQTIESTFWKAGIPIIAAFALICFFPVDSNIWFDAIVFLGGLVSLAFTIHFLPLVWGESF